MKMKASAGLACLVSGLLLIPPYSARAAVSLGSAHLIYKAFAGISQGPALQVRDNLKAKGQGNFLEALNIKPELSNLLSDKGLRTPESLSHFLKSADGLALERSSPDLYQEARRTSRVFQLLRMPLESLSPEDLAEPASAPEKLSEALQAEARRVNAKTENLIANDYPKLSGQSAEKQARAYQEGEDLLINSYPFLSPANKSWLKEHLSTLRFHGEKALSLIRAGAAALDDDPKTSNSVNAKAAKLINEADRIANNAFLGLAKPSPKADLDPRPSVPDIRQESGSTGDLSPAAATRKDAPPPSPDVRDAPSNPASPELSPDMLQSLREHLGPHIISNIHELKGLQGDALDQYLKTLGFGSKTRIVSGNNTEIEMWQSLAPGASAYQAVMRELDGAMLVLVSKIESDFQMIAMLSSGKILLNRQDKK